MTTKWEGGYDVFYKGVEKARTIIFVCYGQIGAMALMATISATISATLLLRLM